MAEEIKIMYDSPEAARPVTMHDETGKKISVGYLSISNRFYNKEGDARYDSHTHKVCECGKEMKKGYTLCKDCQRVKRNEKYNALPFREWDGKTYLTMFDGDEFFLDEDAIIDYCDRHEVDANSLQLVICNPNYLDEVTSEFWDDIAPEDVDNFLPKEVEDALTYLNVAIKNAAPISWSGGSFRTTYEYEPKVDKQD